jgi:hypothetical protein
LITARWLIPTKSSPPQAIGTVCDQIDLFAKTLLLQWEVAVANRRRKWTGL